MSKLQSPLATFSTPGDPFESMKEVTDSKPWGAQCVYKKVDNMIHGGLVVLIRECILQAHSMCCGWDSAVTRA